MTARRKLLLIASGLLTGGLSMGVISVASQNPTKSALGIAALILLFLAGGFFAGADDIDEPPSGKAHV